MSTVRDPREAPVLQPRGLARQSVSGQTYKAARARGFAPWRPKKKTCVLRDQVLGVLHEYRDHLPLTVRQIFYRLVGAHGYDKTELAYKRLLELVNKARRARVIPFDHIRDDGSTAVEPWGFHDKADCLATLRATAEQYCRHRLQGQPKVIEVWVEAGGMVPQIVRVAEPYGVSVYSSGGFDSVTVKHDAAQRFVARDRPTYVIHIGDYDPSGCAIVDSLADDVGQFCADLGHRGVVTFERLAVTLEQVERYGLVTAPQKDTDRRGKRMEATVQAEALDPATLAELVRGAIEARLDLAQWRRVLDAEKTDRAELIDLIDLLDGWAS